MNLSLLSKNMIHVWQVCLSTLSHDPVDLFQWLSTDERLRAQNFARPELRSEFVIAHAALRSILCQYCGLPPERICFKLNNYGKPALEYAESLPVEFNLTHSAGLSLIVVSQCEVGIDLERYRIQTDPLELGRSIFSPIELELLETLPKLDQQRVFFDLWTRKEALLKAIGCGLLSNPTNFTATDCWPIQTLEVSDDLKQSWTVCSLNLDSQYSAAVCRLGNVFDIKIYDWQSDGMLTGFRQATPK